LRFWLTSSGRWRCRSRAAVRSDFTSGDLSGPNSSGGPLSAVSPVSSATHSSSCLPRRMAPWRKTRAGQLRACSLGFPILTIQKHPPSNYLRQRERLLDYAPARTPLGLAATHNIVRLDSACVICSECFRAAAARPRQCLGFVRSVLIRPLDIARGAPGRRAVSALGELWSARYAAPCPARYGILSRAILKASLTSIPHQSPETCCRGAPAFDKPGLSTALNSPWDERYRSATR
jgi:hypothetical protein